MSERFVADALRGLTTRRFADYVLAARDPRRNKPLVECMSIDCERCAERGLDTVMAVITGLDLDKDATEAFGPAKAQYLVGCAIRSLSCESCRRSG